MSPSLTARAKRSRRLMEMQFVVWFLKKHGAAGDLFWRAMERFHGSEGEKRQRQWRWQTGGTLRKTANPVVTEALLTHDAAPLLSRYAIFRCLIRHLSQEQKCARRLIFLFDVCNRWKIRGLCKSLSESRICRQVHASLQIRDSEKGCCTQFYLTQVSDLDKVERGPH